jgi:hypothetical protein
MASGFLTPQVVYAEQARRQMTIPDPDDESI